jgi:hypothetical protein
LVSNIAFELVDAYGQEGGADRRMCPKIILSSPASYLSLPGLAIDADKPNVTAAEFADYESRRFFKATGFDQVGRQDKTEPMLDQ